jgi:dUTP pyrophosphatase
MTNCSTQVKVFKYPHCINIPSYGTNGSSGLDLYAAIDEKITIKKGDIALIPTGIAIILPKDTESNRYEAQVRSRSGLSFKHGVVVINSPGTIDSDYHEEIKVILINHGNNDFIVEKGMKIAQIVISKCEIIQFEEIENIKEYKERGGFGSTGMY